MHAQLCLIKFAAASCCCCCWLHNAHNSRRLPGARLGQLNGTTLPRPLRLSGAVFQLFWREREGRPAIGTRRGGSRWWRRPASGRCAASLKAAKLEGLTLRLLCKVATLLLRAPLIGSLLAFASLRCLQLSNLAADRQCFHRWPLERLELRRRTAHWLAQCFGTKLERGPKARRASERAGSLGRPSGAGAGVQPPPPPLCSVTFEACAWGA